MGKISEPFEIEIGLRQADGLSPFLFNCVLEKVLDEWSEEKTVQKLDQPIKLGRTIIKIECLNFPDDLAILTRDIQTAQKQVELLKQTAEKVGSKSYLKKLNDL